MPTDFGRGNFLILDCSRFRNDANPLFSMDGHLNNAMARSIDMQTLLDSLLGLLEKLY